MTRTGILLANTGTPDAPTPAAVRRYLAEFLSDPRIIETSRWIWWPVLHGVILRVRPARSAALYQRTWTAEGSPLRYHTETLAAELERHLRAQDDDVVVRAGMRYGSGSIAQAMDALEQAGCEHLVVLPLFPQSCGATTASVADAVGAITASRRNPPTVTFVSDYHDHPAYLRALTEHVRASWAGHGRPDHTVLSFHGIPQSYADNGDTYRSRCEHTATLLADALDLGEEWTLSFQSRFGPAQWLPPYTVDVLADLASRDLGRVDVVCPGFAVDCLETVDEIGREAARHYHEHGGGDFRYVPALNASPAHGLALAEVLRPYL